MKLLVTGGAVFIWAHFVRYWLKKNPSDRVITLDKLTYAGNLDNLKEVLSSPHHRFVGGDIGHAPTVEKVLAGVGAGIFCGSAR